MSKRKKEEARIRTFLNYRVDRNGVARTSPPIGRTLFRGGRVYFGERGAWIDCGAHAAVAKDAAKFAATRKGASGE